MRYLGNKESIQETIKDFMKNKGLLENNPLFFDAFCGTGAVSDSIKDSARIILNDNLKLATIFSAGRILKHCIDFNELGFNPIEFFNSNEYTFEGFITNNYAPSKSGRMYFSDYNAMRIDYFRKQIEDWYIEGKITEDEYYYLLACLLESVSKVANVAGVYGAYLKKWDPRAIKTIQFLEVESLDSDNAESSLEKIYNNNLNDIIEFIDCDILYLDPPYTKNKYSVQYHLLETIIRGDIPEISGITGGRHFLDVSDDWSKAYNVHVSFEHVVAKTKAKHIVMSYSSDGIMSKEYILNVLKRYGKEDTLSLIEIPYKKYRNYKTASKDEHFEYVFYVEKKAEKDVVYCSPLNYMGGKSNIVKEMKSAIDSGGNACFLDLMGGGFNVGINAYGYKKYIYNDINTIVMDILLMFKESDTAELLKQITTIINKYGLKKHDKESFVLFRQKYNTQLRFKPNSAVYLYSLMLFGFQQQFRFNSKHEFNNTVGESGYNDSVMEKIVSFSRRIKEMNVVFEAKDFTSWVNSITGDMTVYIDPPYLITLGSYNDGKRGFNGWSSYEEIRLLDFIDSIKHTGCKIVLSNMLTYKEKTNNLLIDWINNNEPIVNEICVRGRNEVLISYETRV